MEPPLQSWPTFGKFTHLWSRASRVLHTDYLTVESFYKKNNCWVFLLSCYSCLLRNSIFSWKFRYLLGCEPIHSNQLTFCKSVRENFLCCLKFFGLFLEFGSPFSCHGHFSIRGYSQRPYIYPHHFLPSRCQYLSQHTTPPPSSSLARPFNTTHWTPLLYKHTFLTSWHPFYLRP